MPNVYAGITVETPQEVLQRIRSAREQALLNARSPEQITQININRALDLAMGNPEVEAARKKQATLSNAMREAQEFSKQEGLSQEEAQLQELSRLRDAFIDTDPEQALAITQMIQQQQVTNLERQKLQQQVTAGEADLSKRNKRYILDPETLESEEIDISTVEGAQQLLAARERGDAVSDKEGSLLNLYNAERARQHDNEQKLLMAQAKKEQVAMEKAGAMVALTPASKTTLQKGLPALRQPMDQLERAAALLNDPRYLSIAGKLKSFKAKAADLLSAGILTQEEAEWYSQVTKVRANIANAVGEFRHERFGGALTEPEIKKGKEYLPDAGDSPQAYLDKTEELYRMFKVGMARGSAALMNDDFRVLTQPAEMFWDEEEDRLFDPKLRQATAAPKRRDTLRSIVERKGRGRQTAEPTQPSGYQPGDWRKFINTGAQ